jgi:hypothetical protein
MARAAHASLCPSTPVTNYQRHRPEQGALYQTVAAYWPQFVEQAEAAGGLPEFVKREVEAYLNCGILERGFVHVECCCCGFERLLAYSCKTRGFCPSCLGRRMNDTAAHLVDRVLPQTPIRQWVCSMPFSLRYPMGYDKKLCADILSAFASELMHWYKLRGKRLLGLPSVNDAHTGAVTLVQRFDSALRLNLHPHTLAIDGVYVQEHDSDKLVFHPLPEPTTAQVTELAGRIAERVEKVMRKHGRWVDNDSADAESDRASLEQPALCACYQASAQGVDVLGQRAGRPTLRLVTTAPALNTSAEPGAVAVVRGFNLHAKTTVDGRDRERLERLCRYIARPPIAQKRLHVLDDGRLRYDMKRVWADGTQAIVLHPLDFIARLCALVPPPYFHLTRFHGVLAPNSSLRGQVVPQAPADAESKEPVQLRLFDANHPDSPLAIGTPEPLPKPPTCGRHPWAWLLKRVFKIDITVCPQCQGSMRVTEVVNDADTIARRLADAGLGPMPPPKPVRTVPGQLRLQFD